MTGYTFMPKDGARILNCGSDVEVFALRIVSGNEVKTARVFVIDAGGFMKPPGLVGLKASGSCRI